jgi:type IV pilus assembly protein PilX
MLILVVVSILGISGAQISMMGERGARNDRDAQVAWQSAEAALIDAEFDIHGPGTSLRKQLFVSPVTASNFAAGCGTSGNTQGLCSLAVAGSAAWQTVDFTETSASKARTTAFGTFTGRSFTAGGAGIQPALVPRYVIEPIRDPNDRNLSNAEPEQVYRVTAMGFGPRPDIQVVLQMLYRN